MLAQASAVGRPMCEAPGEKACRKAFRTDSGMDRQLRTCPGVGRQRRSLGWWAKRWSLIRSLMLDTASSADASTPWQGWLPLPRS